MGESTKSVAPHHGLFLPLSISFALATTRLTRPLGGGEVLCHHPFLAAVVGLVQAFLAAAAGLVQASLVAVVGRAQASAEVAGRLH